MTDERATLPMVPEPDLTPAQRAELSKVFRDPEFWEWFEKQPEPPELATPHE